MHCIALQSQFGGNGSSAVNADDLTSYVGGGGHAEEGDERGHLLRRAEAAHGHPRHLHLRQPTRPAGVAQRRAGDARAVDDPRRDAVDADTVRRPLGGEAPCERLQGTLADRVGGQRRVRDEGRHGGHVYHHGAAVRRLHPPEERVGEAAKVEARIEVGGHDARVVVGRGGRRRPVQGPAGVVDKDVEAAAEEVAHGGDQVLPVAFRGHVADGGGDHVVASALVGPPATACVQVAGGAGAGVHPGAKARQLLHDRKPINMSYMHACIH